MGGGDAGAAAAADGALSSLDRGVHRMLDRLGGTSAGAALRELDLQRLAAMVDRVLEYIHQQSPELERAFFAWADTLFAPKVVVRQYLIAIAIEVGLFSYHLASRLSTRVINKLSVKGRQISDTRRRMAKAKNYYEWLKCAERMDELEGKNRWREVPESGYYNHRMLQEKINQLNNMMQNGDVFQLMFVLRGGLSRGQFGLLNEGLYQHAYSGTKKIVERYLEVVVKALNYVCDVNPALDPIGPDTKLAFFNETRHAYGRTALLLSGGAGLGFYHVGFVKALFDQGILPRVLSGASAGSIISSMIGVRTDDELYAMFTDGIARLDFFKLYKRRNRPSKAARMAASLSLSTRSESNATDASRSSYGPGGPFAAGSGSGGGSIASSTVAGAGAGGGGSISISSGFGGPENGDGHGAGASPASPTEPAQVSFLEVVRELFLETFWYGDGVFLMDTEHFRRRLLSNIGNYTFQEAFDRTGRILNIIVAPANSNDPPRLLNYLTSPHVLVWSAAAVSSAAPGIFEPGYLYVRQADGSERPESSCKWYDGSVEKDLPMEQLAELFNINHFLVSQVNPQATLFSSVSLPQTIWSSPLLTVLAHIMQFCKRQFRSWCRNFLKLLEGNSGGGAWWRGLGLMFTQDYEGRDCDITIMPWAGHIGVVGVCSRILSNPSFQEYLEMLAYGERKTWPLLHAIRSHCVVEMCLEKCVQRLRKAVAKESQLKAAQQQHQQQQAGGGGGAVVKSLGERGRAPSFYTVPSLANLSGLSVTDPVIQKATHQPTTPTNASGAGGGFGGPGGRITPSFIYSGAPSPGQQAAAAAAAAAAVSSASGSGGVVHPSGLPLHPPAPGSQQQQGQQGLAAQYAAHFPAQPHQHHGGQQYPLQSIPSMFPTESGDDLASLGGSGGNFIDASDDELGSPSLTRTPTIHLQQPLQQQQQAPAATAATAAVSGASPVPPAGPGAVATAAQGQGQGQGQPGVVVVGEPEVLADGTVDDGSVPMGPVKSTTMARFYYRRSKSSTALNKTPPGPGSAGPGAPVAQPDTAESGATDQS